jgi:hemerythrin-like domain-containing protein
MERSPLSNVTELLKRDHERLEAIFAEVLRLVGGHDLREAAEPFHVFRDGLEVHIQMEEELLFPMFVRRVRSLDRPTYIMRHEHTVIHAAIDGMCRAIEAGQEGSFQEDRELLHGVLPDHEGREERVVYPSIERLLGPDERLDLLARIRSVERIVLPWERKSAVAALRDPPYPPPR